MLGLFLLHVLGYDVWFYMSHRLLHTRYGWKIHKIHHEKRYPTVWDTYHGHWSESILQSLGFALPWLFFSPDWYAVCLAALFTNARGCLRHDARFSWLVGNHHLLHHEVGNINYGDFYLDWIFKTLKYNE